MMKRLASVILSTIVMGVLFGAAWTPAATDIYVQPATGDDKNPGTKDLPVKTVSAAVARIPPTVATLVTVHLAAGTYPTTGGQDLPEHNLVLRRTMQRTSDGPGDVSIHFVGERNKFDGRAAPAEVIFDWGSSPLIQVLGGSTLVGATVGKVDTVAADTESYIFLNCDQPPANVVQLHNGKIDLK
jgi:hypothetical protein